MNKQPINVERDVNIHTENIRVSRLFFAFLLILYSVTYMTKQCFSGALADIVAEGILTKSQTGLIVAVFYLVYTPMQIIGGYVADRYSPEKLIKLGLLGGAIANAVIFFNQNYYVMLFTWAANAVVQFGIWPSVFKIMTSQLFKSDKAQMIFVMSLTPTIGLLLTFIVAAIVPGWEYNFAVSAAVLFLLFVGMHFADRNLSPYMVKDTDENGALTAKNQALSIDASRSTSSLFWKSGFFIMLIPVFARAAVAQSVKSISPTYIMETFEVTPSVSNLLNIFIIIAGIVGTLSVIFVLKNRIKSEPVGMLIFFILALIFTALLLLPIDLISSIVILSLLSMVGTAPSLLNSYYNSKFAKYGKNATAAGVSNAAGSFGLCISSYVVPFLAEEFGWNGAFTLWLAMLAVSVLSLLIIIPMYSAFSRSEG